LAGAAVIVTVLSPDLALSDGVAKSYWPQLTLTDRDRAAAVEREACPTSQQRLDRQDVVAHLGLFLH